MDISFNIKKGIGIFLTLLGVAFSVWVITLVATAQTPTAVEFTPAHTTAVSRLTTVGDIQVDFGQRVFTDNNCDTGFTNLSTTASDENITDVIRTTVGLGTSGRGIWDEPNGTYRTSTNSAPAEDTVFTLSVNDSWWYQDSANGNACTQGTGQTSVFAYSTTSPSVSGFSPDEGDTDVALDTNIVVTFTGDIFVSATPPTSVVRFNNTTIGNIVTLTRDTATGTAIPFSATLAGNNPITINPTSNLPPNTAIHVSISNAYFDIAGNRGDAITSDFRTTDIHAISITGPTLEAGNIASSFSATDDESGTTTFRYKFLDESGGNTPACGVTTFNGTGEFDYNEGDTARVPSNLRGTAGNGYSICFRSIHTADDGTFPVAYAKSSQIAGQVNPPTPTIALEDDTNIGGDGVTRDNGLIVSGLPDPDDIPGATSLTHSLIRYDQNASGACDTPVGLATNLGWRASSSTSSSNPTFDVSTASPNYPLNTEGDWCVTSRYTVLSVASAYATPIAVTYDNTAPDAPGQPDLTDASDTFYSSGTNTHGFNNDNITSQTNASFMLSGLETNTGGTIDAELREVGGSNNQSGVTGEAVTSASQTIVLDVGGGPGTYNGDQYILRATLVDLAGNRSGQSPGLTVTYDNTAPVITSDPTYTTDNDLNADTHAREGNNVVATFTTEQQVGVFGSTFDGRATTLANTSGNTYTETYTVVAGANANNASFDLGDVTDLAGNILSTSAENSGVRIDTLAPTFGNQHVGFNYTDSGARFLGIVRHLNAGDDFTVTLTAQEPLHSSPPVTLSFFGRTYTLVQNSLSPQQYRVTLDIQAGDNDTTPDYDFASIRDRAGNTYDHTSREILNAVVDTDTPDAPDTPDLVAADDSFYDANGYTLGSNTDNITNDRTPRVDIGGFEINAQFSYSINGETTKALDALALTESFTLNAENLIDQSEFADGEYSIVIFQTDPAGNTSSGTGEFIIHIDGTPPNKPSTPDLIDASDSGVSNTDNYTNDTNPYFSLGGSAGDLIVLGYVDTDENPDADIILSSVDNGGDDKTGGEIQSGQTTITVQDVNGVAFNDLADSDVDFFSTAIDSAGNTINSDNRPVYFDTETRKPEVTPRSENDSGASSGDRVTNETSQTAGINIFGSEGAATNRGDGAEVTLYEWVDANTDEVIDYDNEVTQIGYENNVSPNSFAIFSADTPENPPIIFEEGVHILVACQIDDAGNETCNEGSDSLSVIARLVIDTTAPDAPTVPDLNPADDSFGENANGARSGTNSDNVTNIQANLTFASLATGSGTPVVEENNNHDQHQIRFYRWVDANTDNVVDDAELTQLQIPTGAGDDNVRGSGNIVSLTDTGYDSVVGTGSPGTAKDLYTTGGDILEEGTHQFVARQYDIAGNLSASSTPFELEIDVTRPAAITGDLILHPTSDTGTSPVDKQTSNAAPIFRIEHTSDSTDVDYYEIRRLRLTDSFVAAAGEDWEYPSDSSVVQQTSYEYFKTTDTQERTIDDTTIQVEVAPTLTPEAGATQADGAYQSPVGADFGTTGVTVAVTSMDITHFNTWYAFKIYPVDLAGNTRQGVDSNNIRILVLPPVPSTVDLQAADDSAAPHFSTGNADNITSTTDWTLSSQYQNLTTPERDNDAAAGVAFVEIKVAREDGAGNEIEGQFREVRLSVADADITAPGSPNDPYTFSIEFDVSDAANFGPDAPDGVYAITAIAFNGGGESGTRSQPLRITLDTEAPVPQAKLDLSIYQYFTGASPGSNRHEVNVYHTEGVTESDRELNGAVYVYADDVVSNPLERVSVGVPGRNTSDEISGNDIKEDYDYWVEYVDAAGNTSARAVMDPNLAPTKLTSYETATDTYIVVPEILGDSTTVTSSISYPKLASNSCFSYASDRTDNFTTIDLANTLAATTETLCVVVVTNTGSESVVDVRGTAENLISNFEVLDADDSGISANDNITNNTTPQLTGTTIPTSTGRIEYKTEDGVWGIASDVTVITLGLSDYDTENGSRFTIDIPTTLVDDTYNVRGYLFIRGEGDTPIGPIALPDFIIDTTVTTLPNFDNNNYSNTARLGAGLFANNTSGTDNERGVNDDFDLDYLFGDANTFENTYPETLYVTFNFAGTVCGTAAEIDPTEGRGTASGESNTTQTCVVSGINDGLHIATADFTDTAGNTVGTVTAEHPIILDTVAPAITILRLNDTDGTIDTNTRFIASASDANEVSLQSRDNIATDSCTITTSSLTSYTSPNLFDPSDTSIGVCFVGTDLANNNAAAHTDDAIEGIASLELDAPGITYQNVRYAQPSSSTTFTGVSASGALAKLYVVADGVTPTASPTPSGGSATVLSDTSVSITSPFPFINGSYDIYGSIIPNGGTETPLIKVLDLTIDSSAPSPPSTFEFTSSSSKSLITNSPSSVGLTFAGVAENLAIDIGPESDPDLCKVNEGNTSETYVTGTCDLSSLTDTTHTLETEFISRAGVRASGPDLSIEIDTAAPSTTFTYVSGNRFLSESNKAAFSQVFEIEDQTEVNDFVGVKGIFTLTKVSGNRYSSVLTDPTAAVSATNGAISITGETITDAAGNTTSGALTAAVSIDTEAPTISSVGEVDVSDRRAPEITVVAVHNQDAANAGVSETLTPIFTGRCSEFAISNPSVATSSSPEDDVAETYVFVGDRPRSGAYSDCTIALSDEAGNTTAQTTIPEFRIRSSGGGLSRSLGSGGSAPATLEPVTFTFTPIEGETLGPIPSIPTQAPIRITSIEQGLQELQRLRTILSQLRASLERSIPSVPRTNLIRIPIITPTLIPTQTPTQTRPFTPFIPLFAPPIPNTFSPQLSPPQIPFTPFIPSFSAPTPIIPSLIPPLAPAPRSR